MLHPLHVTSNLVLIYEKFPETIVDANNLRRLRKYSLVNSMFCMLIIYRFPVESGLVNMFSCKVD